MKQVYATGVEIRPQAPKVLEDGTRVPQHDLVVVRTIAEDLKARSGLSKSSFVRISPEQKLQETLEHFPVDGIPLEVTDFGGLCSRVRPNSARHASTRLRERSPIYGPHPDADPDVDLLGCVSGWGVGIEKQAGKWHVVPFLSVRVLDTDREGHEVSKLMCGRLTRWAERTALIDQNDWLFREPSGEAGIVPALFDGLRGSYALGTEVLLEIRKEKGMKYPYTLFKAVNSDFAQMMAHLPVEDSGHQPRA